MIDLHFFADGLAVGAHFPMQAAGRLAEEHGITHVVDVRVEDCDDEAVLALHGIRLLHLPTQDTCAISQRLLRDGVAFVCAALERGERVLVHCQYGIGRSVLLGLCVLVARGLAPIEALERAKAARPVVSPSPEQLEAFIEFCEERRGAAAMPWPAPTFDELAEIAYRHLRADATREAARAASTRAE